MNLIQTVPFNVVIGVVVFGIILVIIGTEIGRRMERRDIAAELNAQKPKEK